MWSIQAVENGIFERREKREPRLGSDGDIIIKVDFACIGRIDVAALYGRLPLARKKPYVIGNEGTGTIVELNAAAKEAGFYAGQAVSGICTQPCGCCGSCRRGLPNLCDNPHNSGMLSEYVGLRIAQTESVPQGVPLPHGALMAAVNRAMYIMDKTGVRPGGSLLILGCNGIAQICVMLAKLYGVHAIAVMGSS